MDPAFEGADFSVGADWLSGSGGSYGTSDQYWKRSTVAATFPGSCDVEGMVELLRLQLGVSDEALTYAVSSMGDDVLQKDWVAEVQSGWPPLVTCEGTLVVKFPWHSSSDIASAVAKAEAKVCGWVGRWVSFPLGIPLGN